MAKIPELQELLENAERMCDAVDDIAGRRHTTFGLLRVELCLFLAHLCKADFHLADEEAAFIADNLSALAIYRENAQETCGFTRYSHCSLPADDWG